DRVAGSRVALVTGANRGIGFEVCRQLAMKGLRVILTARTTSKAESAARRLQAEGLVVAAAVVDVTDADSIRALRKHVGGIDVLVNNAAVLIGEDAAVLDVPLKALRAT